MATARRGGRRRAPTRRAPARRAPPAGTASSTAGPSASTATPSTANGLLVGLAVRIHSLCLFSTICCPHIYSSASVLER
jgi:hypothetical protein